MNFNQLLAKLQEIDKPVETAPVIEEPLQDCGPMPTAQSSMPDTPPPSMSINLNAQGLDNIEELMKLIKAVNPEMDKPMMPAPSISISPMDKPMDKPMGLSPLKMLPDLDKEEGDMSTDYNKDGELDAHEKDHASEMPLLRSLDQDKDGDHDMDDHNMQKKEKDEAYANSMAGSEPETSGIDAAIPDGNDLNKPKKSFSGKPYRGDNPMAAGAYESTDLRAQIRAELLQRLAEAKGAK